MHYANIDKPSSMLNIAITGAGPVGLTLARLLLPYTSDGLLPNRPRLTITIFEKDASPTSRTSLGGTLDLHPPTGLAAMKAMGLYDEFLKYARLDGEEMRMCDLNGTCYVHQKEMPIKGQERPEIDRVRLMEVLLGAVPEALVQWGKAVKDVYEVEKGRWQVRFDDGSVEGPFDLVVGADGAWSKVRKALTDVAPSYSGISAVSGTIDEKSAGDRWSGISGLVGKGNNFNYSYGRSITGQRLGDGSIKCGFMKRTDLGWIENLRIQHTGDDEALRNILLKEFEHWVPQFQDYIHSAKKLWCSPLWELPVGTRYEHQRGLVLVGDSAHLMTPFAGEGVNAGMKDALDLATAIEAAISDKQDLDTAVAEFEVSMFKRAEVFMAETMTNKTGMFAEDAPYSFFTDMVGVVAREFGYDLNKGWLSWTPIRPLAYGIFWTVGTFGALRRRISERWKGKK